MSALMKEVSIADLSADIRAAIAELKKRPEIEQTGIVTRIGDGVVWIYGLTSCGYNEMIEVDAADGSSVTAFAFNLAEDEIGAVILGEDTLIKAGAKAKLTGKILEVPIGQNSLAAWSTQWAALLMARARLKRPKPVRSKRSPQAFLAVSMSMSQ